MIYPDVNIEKWCKKHNLDLDGQNTCEECGLQLTGRPYITNCSVGVEFDACKCGAYLGHSFGHWTGAAAEQMVGVLSDLGL